MPFFNNFTSLIKMRILQSKCRRGQSSDNPMRVNYLYNFAAIRSAVSTERDRRILGRPPSSHSETIRNKSMKIYDWCQRSSTNTSQNFVDLAQKEKICL